MLTPAAPTVEEMPGFSTMIADYEKARQDLRITFKPHREQVLREVEGLMRDDQPVEAWQLAERLAEVKDADLLALQSRAWQQKQERLPVDAGLRP